LKNGDKVNYITWLYFLEDKENSKDIFLYGISLPTQCEIQNTKIESIKLSKNKKIVLFKTISDKLNIVNEDKLIFDNYMGKGKFNVNFIDKQNIILISKKLKKKIPYSFIGYPIYTTVYYTNEIYEYIHLIDIKELNDLLYKLSIISGLDFQKEYFKHIGCYEIGELDIRVENNNTLFKIKTLKKDNDIEFYFDKSKEYQEKEFVIHLMIYNENDEVLSDNIYFINNFKSNLLISLPEKDVAGYDYWIFNKEKLLNYESLSFIKGYTFSIFVIEQNYKIPKNNFSKKSPMSNNDQNIEVYTPVSRQEIKNIFQINEINRQIYENIKIFHKKEDIYKYGKWLKKEKYNELIDFFNEITKDGKYRLTFIDPFISSTACLEYLYHIKNTQVDIRLISCFAKGISPDDNTKKETVKEHIEQFILVLKHLQNFKLPVRNIKWYNFKEKTFHDRYLYVENLSTNEIFIFSISNSLNNLLSNYDNLLILPLNGKVFDEAKEYIEELINKCNNSNKIFPKDIF
jgi:hypothetical protein